MKTAKIRGALELERNDRDGTITVEHSKPQFGPKLDAWTIRPVFDAEARSVRFDALDAQGQPVAVQTPTGAPKGKPWGPNERAVLDAVARGGPAVHGVLLERVAPRLDDQAVRRAIRKLVDVKALVEAGKVKTKGRAAIRYALPGQVPTAGGAVDQAEAILREARE
jgi:hypothetical protein